MRLGYFGNVFVLMLGDEFEAPAPALAPPCSPSRIRVWPLVGSNRAYFGDLLEGDQVPGGQSTWIYGAVDHGRSWSITALPLRRRHVHLDPDSTDLCPQPTGTCVGCWVLRGTIRLSPSTERMGPRAMVRNNSRELAGRWAGCLWQWAGRVLPPSGWFRSDGP